MREGPGTLPLGFSHSETLYCTYIFDCAHTHSHTHTYTQRMMSKKEKWKGRSAAVFCGVLQQCVAVLHNDGWDRKWQHKWLLKRGNGSICKNYVSPCLRPQSHVALELLCHASRYGRLPSAAYIAGFVKTLCHSPLGEPAAGIYSRLCAEVTVPDLLGTGTRCKVEPALMPYHFT